MSENLGRLRNLSAVLGDASATDDVARAALEAATELPGVFRAGLALNRTGGRQLQFVSTDQDALGPSSVRWCLIDAYDRVPLIDAVRSGSDVYLPALDDLRAAYPDIYERQRALGTACLVALALATPEERLGGLMLTFDTERTFSSSDRFFLSAFASQITQALRRVAVHLDDQTTSEQLQRSLMARTLPLLDGLSFGAHYQPGGLNADVGGDWYDVMELASGEAIVVLGDVMGKGVPAAIVMGEIRAAVRAYAVIDPTPSVVLARLDALVTAHPMTEQLVTMAYGVVSPDRSQINVSAAGHPPPLLVHPTGTSTLLEDCTGPALGLGAGPWPVVEVALNAHDSLLFYSDGLVETRARDLFTGIDELIAHVDALPRRRRHPRELVAGLLSEISDKEVDDDVTMLAVSVTPAGSVQDATTLLPSNTRAPGVARRFIRATLSAWGASQELAETAELCVSELVTNAVIHTGTSSQVTARLDDEFLTVLVHDGGGRGTVTQSADDEPLKVSGRGLGLVEALAAAWGSERTASDGTTVWFELERASSDAAVESAS